MSIAARKASYAVCRTAASVVLEAAMSSACVRRWSSVRHAMAVVASVGASEDG